MTSILVVDNYDSFVYTIVGYLNQLGASTVVVRNDAVPPADERAGFDGSESVLIGFELPVPERVTYVARTHPLVETLGSWIVTSRSGAAYPERMPGIRPH